MYLHRSNEIFLATWHLILYSLLHNVNGILRESDSILGYDKPPDLEIIYVGATKIPFTGYGVANNMFITRHGKKTRIESMEKTESPLNWLISQSLEKNTMKILQVDPSWIRFIEICIRYKSVFIFQWFSKWRNLSSNSGFAI